MKTIQGDKDIVIEHDHFLQNREVRIVITTFIKLTVPFCKLSLVSSQGRQRKGGMDAAASSPS